MKKQVPDNEAPLELDSKSAIVDAAELSSAVLKRLVEEVREEKLEPATAYNRVHNRHNRGR